jgi:hypothetical protein
MHKKESGFGIIEIMIIVITVGILGYVGYQIYSYATGGGKTIPTAESDTGAQAGDDWSDKDRLKWERHYGLHGHILAYKLTRQTYPATSAVAWQELVDMPDNGNQSTKDDDITDPFTDTIYKFTLKNPKYGEIQYRYPSSCDEDQKDFAPAKSTQSYAFRLRYSDGIRCSSSL